MKPPVSVRRKLLFSLIAVLGFFLVIDLILLVFGVQPLRQTQDIFVGFEPGTSLFQRDGNRFVTNKFKLEWFNSQEFSAQKDEHRLRIVCLGGSTTVGRPYDDRTSYVGWLREILRESHPDKQFDVINCGGVSYASYRLSLLAEELVKYEPDVFIIYTGHNEFLEKRTYQDMEKQSFLVRQVLKATSHWRLYSVIARAMRKPGERDDKLPLLAAEVDTILENTAGLKSYTRDEEYSKNVIHQFEQSLAQVCLTTKASGAQVILVKPAMNLRSSSPFKSEYLSDETRAQCEPLLAAGRLALKSGELATAISRFGEALAIDSRHADTLYVMGQALERNGDFKRAKEYYLEAKENDVCPLRALAEIQQIITTMADKYDLPLVDYPTLLEDRCRSITGHTILGEESFLDHVHPKIVAHRELGGALAGELVKLGVIPSQGSGPEFAAKLEKRVMGSVDKTEHGIALCRLTRLLIWTGKHEDALRLAIQAEELCPDHPDVVGQHGRALEFLNRPDEAMEKYKQAQLLYPYNPLNLKRLGELSLRQQEFDQAATYLQQALKVSPPTMPIQFFCGIHLSLADCYVFTRQRDKALRELQAVMRISPGSPEAQQRLNWIRVKWNAP